MIITEEKYLQTRLDVQIDWYDTKSQKFQRKYKIFKGVQIILSASIPLLVGLIADFQFMAIIVSIIGVIITSIEGWLAITMYHEIGLNIEVFVKPYNMKNICT